MVEYGSNDNDAAHDRCPRKGDPHGQAALLLVESLIHGLVARSVLTVAEAVEVVDVATEIRKDVASDSVEQYPSSQEALTILNAIRESLAIDLSN